MSRDTLNNVADSTTSSKPDELTPEGKGALVTRAKDVIAGRVPPPELETPPEVERFMEREYKDCDPPPTEEALRRISQRLSLEAKYRGCPVICLYTRDGTLPVLAAGKQEIEALLSGLSGDETAKVVLTDTCNW